STPDYFPLTVMNAVLGGQFSSRINLNLREEKGYTYGARTHFAFRIGPGPFDAGCSVATKDTAAALAEMVKELTDITGPSPVPDADLAFAKENLIKGSPGEFEPTSDVAGPLASMVIYNLPADYYANYQKTVEAVTNPDVARVARQYIDPNRL